MTETITWGGTQYITCARSGYLLLAVCTEDVCCNQFLAVHMDGSIKLARCLKGERSVNLVARAIAASCFTITDGKVAALNAFNAGNFLTKDIDIPPLHPKTVPGSSKGSTYVVVATTPQGIISRRNSDGMVAPRIRVVKNSGLAWPAKAFQLNEHGLKWGTVSEDHVSANGNSAERTALIVARGLQVLLNLGKNL